MKIANKIKAAYAREQQVREIKWKERDERTLNEWQELDKWNKEKERNHAILGLTTGIISLLWLRKLNKEEKNND